MNETPLRLYLGEIGMTAEAFAIDHGFSPWSVRHWTRGNKHPSLDMQIRLETATAGAVTPADWLRYCLAAGVAVCSACDLRAEAPQVASCTRTDCPMRAREEQSIAA
jgi:hypothetical protein